MLRTAEPILTFRNNPRSRMKMISFVVRGKKLVRVRKPLPHLRAGWALVRVRLAGICNTDVEILR